MWVTFKRLFNNESLVVVSALWASITSYLFPTSAVGTSAIAVLIMIMLDLLTKLFALAKKNGGMRKAIKTHKITSNKLAKGTIDKLIIFGIVLVINGCAYKLLVIESISKWFTQAIFTVMFLRDTLSIFENLSDSGIQGLDLYKKLIKKKIDETINNTEGGEDK